MTTDTHSENVTFFCHGNKVTRTRLSVTFVCTLPVFLLPKKKLDGLKFLKLFLYAMRFPEDNRQYFSKQHLRIGLCDGDAICSL